MSEERFPITCDAIRRITKHAEPGNVRRQVELCIAAAVSIALSMGHTEREAFDVVDALFTEMIATYFDPNG